jgi:uncharacterized protein (TIGR02444 family)
MSTSNQQQWEDYWAFSLAVYGYPEVAQACLVLQNSAGVDVNVMLIALWAARRLGRAITPEEIMAGDRDIAAWRKEVVEPLRKIRTGLKEGSFRVSRLDTEGLRNVIKSAELNAERVEQGILAEWAGSLPVNDDLPDATICTQTANRVVDFYADKMGCASRIGGLRQLSDVIARVTASQPWSAES